MLITKLINKKIRHDPSKDFLFNLTYKRVLKTEKYMPKIVKKKMA